jgi:hypothetical protein
MNWSLCIIVLDVNRGAFNEVLRILSLRFLLQFVPNKTGKKYVMMDRIYGFY